MMTRSLDPRSLLRNCFASFQSIYFPLLLLGVPDLVINLLNRLVIEEAAIQAIISLVHSILIAPFLAGAAIFYMNRHLLQERITIFQALKATLPNVGHLILGTILLILVLVLIPIILATVGFYLSLSPGVPVYWLLLLSILALIYIIYLGVRFGFTLYAIAINNASAVDGFRHSWQLVRGRWWAIFGAELLGSLVFLLPLLLVSGILTTSFGLDSNATRVLLTVLGFLISPVVGLYFVLLYLRLRAIADPLGSAIDVSP